MGVHTVPEETRTPQQVRGMDQPRYGGIGRRSTAVGGVVSLHDVGQETKAGEGSQRGGEGERAVAAAVQQLAPATVLPTGTIQPERPGARYLRRLLSHGKSPKLFFPRHRTES